MENQQPAFLTDIPQEALLYRINEFGKKIPDAKCIGKHYSIKQCQALQQDGDEIMIAYNIKDTEYVVVDIDTNDYTNEDLFNDTDIDSCFVNGNTKGQHIWCRMRNKTDEYKKNVVKCGIHAEMDFLGFMVWERIGKEWTHDDACFLHEDSFIKCFKTSAFEKPKPKQSICGDGTNTELLQKVVGLIDKKYCDLRYEWSKIVMAMKKCGLPREYADTWSKKSGSYTADGFNGVWEQYSIAGITVGEGTLKYYAKKSNECEYTKLMRDEKHLDDDVINPFTFDKIRADESKQFILPDDFADLSKKKQTELKALASASNDQLMEETVKLKQTYFERFNVKIDKPACYGVYERDTLLIETGEEMKHRYKNYFGGNWCAIWNTQVSIKSYSTIDFLPPPRVCKSYTLNTYTGLKASRIKSGSADFSMFMTHLDILTGHDGAGTEYMLNYLAHLIQRPGEMPRVALVFQSEQGVGKNLFFENFAKYMLGEEYLLQTAEMEKITGRFPMISNKLMVIMDETSGKDSFSNSDKIKNLITADTLPFERKGVDGIVINNCGRYLFFSNNLIPVKIENSDRRFVVFKCANDVQNNKEYFDKLLELFKNDCAIKSFYEFLSKRDISNWDTIKHRPFTKAYSLIKQATIPIIARYFDYMINRFENATSRAESDAWSKQQSSGLYGAYKVWLNMNGFDKHEISVTRFGTDVGAYETFGITKKKISGVQVYTFDYPVLKAYLIKQDWFEI